MAQLQGMNLGASTQIPINTPVAPMMTDPIQMGEWQHYEMHDASEEQVEGVLQSMHNVKKKLEDCRVMWRELYPHNSELCGMNSTKAVVSHAETTVKMMPVLHNLPYLQTPRTKNSDANAKVTFNMAEKWAYSFEMAIQVNGLMVEDHWERLVLKALDKAQKDQ
ncbi:hypothetical protein DFQ30_001653 [Apophysomyces sp. BC1015]|nr:hypothetical protein DFQ30_001653 [Apophysomyces sp. BC1015]